MRKISKINQHHPKVWMVGWKIPLTGGRPSHHPTARCCYELPYLTSSTSIFQPTKRRSDENPASEV